MNENRTLWKWLADWFDVRRATRLVVDGLLVLLASGIVYVLWTLWVDRRGEPLLVARTALDRNISVLFSVVHSSLLYLGIVVVAVGCSRIIADACRGRDAAHSEGRDSKP